jgi:phenylalanyl-tRNA synthetase beta chain
LVNGTEIGYLKQVQEKCIDISAAQINLDKLIEFSIEKVKYKRLSKFPSSKRDLALVMKQEVTYKEVVDFIKSIEMPFCCEISLFDIYQGKQLEKGYKSLAIALEFKDETRTLNDEEVGGVFENIIERLRADKNIKLRSLS